MNRLSIKQQVLNFIFLLLLQLPLIHKAILFDRAFGFFYVGFLLLLPVGLSRSYLLLIGFLTGMLVDIFTDTPGMHAFSCVFVMFFRNFWLSVVSSDWRELGNLNVGTLKNLGFMTFIVPLVLVHHLFLFSIENGGFHLFGMLINKVFMSTMFSSAIIFSLNFLMAANRKRT